MTYRPSIPPRSTARRTITSPARRSGISLLFYRVGRIRRSIGDHPWRAAGIAGSVAVGVAIAIAIIAASNGIDAKINYLLGTDGADRVDQLRQVGINVSDIQSVLHDTRNLLSHLSVGFTAALVGLVTLVTTSQRRRDIAIDRMRGIHTETVISELVGEAFILCMIGGLLGIVAGLILCGAASDAIPLLPMRPSFQDISAIFPVTTLATFAITTVIAAVLAKTADVDLG
jgi:ABC-type antimicrobial peptide transport system permease subunit